MRRATCVLLATLIALPAAAQTAAPSPPPAAIAPDAERQSLGTQIAARLFPVGTYQRMMTGTMDKLLAGVMGSVGTMPIAQLATMGGLSTDDAAALPPVTLAGTWAALLPSGWWQRWRSLVPGGLREHLPVGGLPWDAVPNPPPEASGAPGVPGDDGSPAVDARSSISQLPSGSRSSENQPLAAARNQRQPTKCDVRKSCAKSFRNAPARVIPFHHSCTSLQRSTLVVRSRSSTSQFLRSLGRS